MPGFMDIDLTTRGGRYMTTPMKESDCRKAAIVVARHSRDLEDCMSLLKMLGLVEDSSDD